MPQSLGQPDDDSILESHIKQVLTNERASYHMPGHKGGLGAPERGRTLLGGSVYAADLSELSGFDYLHGASTALVDAQASAAELFGADRTWYLINGATVGNIAAIGATVGDGDAILVARDSHRSVYAGIVVAGAHPIYLSPVRNNPLDGLFGLHLAEVESALDRHPEIRAVHVTSPSYYGFTTSIREIARLAHARKIPLIVDEAHGAHFIFDESFPPSALSSGADLVVQSPHKTLGSLTQSSLLHAQSTLVDVSRVQAILGMLQSSSPSALLLLSLDLAISEMAQRGRDRWGMALDIARRIRREVNTIDGVRAYDNEIKGSPGISTFDETKIVIDVDGLGTTGFAAARWLKSTYRINPEFADLRRLVFSITIGDTRESEELLVTALRALGSHREHLVEHPNLISLWPTTLPVEHMHLRQAQQQKSLVVTADEATGRTCAEMIVPYPPGVPLLVPGEEISTEVVKSMRQLIDAGCRVVGLSDPTGLSLRVVEDD